MATVRERARGFGVSPRRPRDGRPCRRSRNGMSRSEATLRKTTGDWKLARILLIPARSAGKGHRKSLRYNGKYPRWVTSSISPGSGVTDGSAPRVLREQQEPKATKSPAQSRGGSRHGPRPRRTALPRSGGFRAEASTVSPVCLRFLGDLLFAIRAPVRAPRSPRVNPGRSCLRILKSTDLWL
jgi:hypothetical protein